MYLRRDVQDRFWTTLASYQWDNHEDGAFRFMQYGTGSIPVVDGLTAALGFIEKIGMSRIEQWDASLTKRLRDGLASIPAVRIASPANSRLTAAITTFRVNGMKAKALQDALWEKRVRVRAQNDESFACKCHGSRFDRDGNPTKPPAKLPLARLQVVVE